MQTIHFVLNFGKLWSFDFSVSFINFVAWNWHTMMNTHIQIATEPTLVYYFVFFLVYVLIPFQSNLPPSSEIFKWLPFDHFHFNWLVKVWIKAFVAIRTIVQRKHRMGEWWSGWMDDWLQFVLSCWKLHEFYKNNVKHK